MHTFPKESHQDNHTWAWGISSVVLMLVGYAIYITFIINDFVEPNSTSWSLWALGGAVEAWSYWKLVTSTISGKRRSSELALALPAIACAIFAVVLAAVAVSLGKFGWPTPFEWFIAILDMSVVFTYVIVEAITKEESKAAKAASALMVADIVLSFVPIWFSTWQNPSGENVIPWTIWACSYGIIAFVALLQLDKSRKERAWLFLYPSISAFTHGFVAYLATTGGA